MSGISVRKTAAMAMKFSEISQVDYQMECFKPFSIVHTDGMKFAIIDSDGKGVIFEIEQSTSSDDPFYLPLDTLKASDYKPILTNKIMKDFKKVYNDSDILEKQIIVMDPMFAVSLSEQPQVPKINCICWPSGCYRITFHPLAIVSTFGGCEIKTNKYAAKGWKTLEANITEIWKNEYNKVNKLKPKNIESLKKYVYDICITYCCWSDVTIELNRWTLYCGTASGYLLIVDFKPPITSILSSKETNFGKIIYMNSFTFHTKSEEKLQTFLFVANVDGLLKVFKVIEHDIIEVSTLWNSPDRMGIQTIEVHYIQKLNEIIVITCKAAHFLVFLLSVAGELLLKRTHYVGNLNITGLQSITPTKYVVVTQNGYTECIEINCENFEITSTEIKHNLNVDSYKVLGLIGTVNKVAWIFLLFPFKLFERNHKKPTVLSICTLSSIIPMDILVSAPNTKVYQLSDCAEVLRCAFIKGIITELPFTLDLEPAQLNKAYLHRLKLRTIALNAKYCAVRRKRRSNTCLVIEDELQCIRNLIFVIKAYHRLNRIKRLQTPTHNQILSAKYFRKRILDFCLSNPVQPFNHIREIFDVVFEETLKETEKIGLDLTEKCVLCDKDVDINTGRCEDDHVWQRCCITFLQVPIFSSLACQQCKCVAIDDENLCKEVLCPNEDISCPLCDFPLVQSSVEIHKKGYS